VGSYLIARRAGGEWLLRMEDLDTPRVVAGAADDILSTLETLGLCWDREVVWQSRRSHLYQEALDRLIRDGWAYPCGCSRTEIARIATASAEGGHAAPYPGTCRLGLPPGKEPRAFRVRAPATPIRFHDQVQGEQIQDVSCIYGDFVVRRADGPFAYHLAVVVDDAAAGVTDVVRGADLLDATPCHIHLQTLLGLQEPRYAHLPLVTGPAGAKLSKRDAAVSLTSGRNLARDGGSLLWATLRFLGQRPPQALYGASAADVLAWGRSFFDSSAIPRSGGPFTMERQ
jgi:glutamyl-Q tRNA(Asp) synthetase